MIIWKDAGCKNPKRGVTNLMYLRLRAFTKTIAEAGKREQLTTADIKVSAVSLTAKRTNTGYIYIGDNQVSSTNYGWELVGYDNICLSAEEFGLANAEISLKDIWIDSSVSTDGIAVGYLERAE